MEGGLEPTTSSAKQISRGWRGREPQKARIKKKEGILSPVLPIPTWGLTDWKQSGVVGAAACGREHPRLLIPPSRKVLCRWSVKMHKQE